MSVDAILNDWNELDPSSAARVILPCNGSRAWANGVAGMRPFADANQLFEGSNSVWRSLNERDRQEAFDSHPRLGEQNAKAATAESLTWSTHEQNMANSDDAMREAFAQGNRDYEAKFGRIFLLCATGRNAAEMLEILRMRLNNDAATEQHEAAEQQRLITLLRLRKWLRMPSLTCAEIAASAQTQAV